MDPVEAAYASLIEGMDKSLGDIMHFLDEKKIADNTVIIFMSDNGGLSVHGRGGKPNTQNLPLKAGKGSVHEGGIREPMMVKWPGVTRPGSVNEQYLIVEDFFPTILEMAGLKNYKTIQQTDGISFVPFLKNAQLRNNNRSLYWHVPNKWTEEGLAPGVNYFSAMRKGDWKLIYSLRTGTASLYNLKNDIGEQHDLATKNPTQTKAMVNQLFRQLKKWNAAMPIEKATGKPLAYAGN